MAALLVVVEIALDRSNSALYAMPYSVTYVYYVVHVGTVDVVLSDQKTG